MRRLRKRSCSSAATSHHRGLGAQQRDGQDHVPDDHHADLDALPHPDQRRWQIGRQLRRIQSGQHAEREQDRERRDRVEPEPFAEASRRERDCREHKGDPRGGPDDVQRVGQRRPTCSDDFPLVPFSWADRIANGTASPWLEEPGVPTSDRASCPPRAVQSIRGCAARESQDVLRCRSRRQSCGARFAAAFERSSTLSDRL